MEVIPEVSLEVGSTAILYGLYVKDVVFKQFSILTFMIIENRVL